MILTEKQKRLIANVDQIGGRSTLKGAHAYFLAGDNCTSTIVSLIVRGMIERTPDGKRVRQTSQGCRVTAT